jgi:hypothetical protein
LPLANSSAGILPAVWRASLPAARREQDAPATAAWKAALLVVAVVSFNCQFQSSAGSVSVMA